MYWHKTHQNSKILAFSAIFALYKLYPPMGYTHCTPYFINTPNKLKILSILFKSILILHYMEFMYITYKIEYPMASGGHRPLASEIQF